MSHGVSICAIHVGRSVMLGSVNASLLPCCCQCCCRHCHCIPCHFCFIYNHHSVLPPIPWGDRSDRSNKRDCHVLSDMLGYQWALNRPKKRLAFFSGFEWWVRKKKQLGDENEEIADGIWNPISLIDSILKINSINYINFSTPFGGILTVQKWV